MTTEDGSAATTPTGLSGYVLAAGRDGAGLYAWIDGDGGVQRIRPGAPWTVDRGTFVPAFQPLDAAVAADGTLWLSFSEPNSDPFDHEAYVSLQTLGPTDSQLSAIERADPGSYDDEISQAHIVLADDGVHMVIVAFAKDDGTGIESYVPARLRTGPGTWIAAPLLADQTTVPTARQYAFAGTTLGVVVTDQSTQVTTLAADVSMSATEQPVPVWPAVAEGLVADGNGVLHPLFTTSTVAYAPIAP